MPKGGIVKEHKLSEINEKYYNSFKSKFKDKEASWRQYKVDVGAFMEKHEGDIAKVKVLDIQAYASANSKNEKTKNNKEAHIRSFLQWIVKNDVEGAKDKIDRDVLVYLI